MHVSIIKQKLSQGETQHLYQMSREKRSQNTIAKSYLTLFQLAAPKSNLKSICYYIQYLISVCSSTRTGFQLLLIIEASRGHANKEVALHLVDNAELCSIAMVSTGLLHGIPNHIHT